MAGQLTARAHEVRVLLALAAKRPPEAARILVPAAARARLEAVGHVASGARAGAHRRPRRAILGEILAAWPAVGNMRCTLQGRGARAARTVKVAERVVECVDRLGAESLLRVWPLGGLEEEQRAGADLKVRVVVCARSRCRRQQRSRRTQTCTRKRRGCLVSRWSHCARLMNERRGLCISRGEEASAAGPTERRTYTW